MLEGPNDLEEGVTHLLLDEVHERTLDNDFLLIIVRRLIVQRPQLKIILMSATVDAKKFSKYLNGAPIIDIPGRAFPVESRYLEDIIEMTGYENENNLDGIAPHKDSDESEDNATGPKGIARAFESELKSYSVKTHQTLKYFNEYRINFDLIVMLLEQIAARAEYSEYSRAILVFLPGLAELTRLRGEIVAHPSFRDGWNVYFLHSTIAAHDQEKAFVVHPRGIRKIVLATNIAETGITIPDITCVIDTGKHKEMRFNEKRQLSQLVECFISRANAKQRRGRAGRVRSGLVSNPFP